MPNPTQPLDFVELSPDRMIETSRAFYQTMKRRRTVRDFDSRPVPAEVIENAIRAAGTAPNGANIQPWHFVVVTDTQTKRRIRTAAEQIEKAFYEKRASEEWLNDLEPLGTDHRKPFLETAPCLIAVFAQKYTVDERGEKHNTYFPIESTGLATGVLITALHTAGLATLTYTPSPMKFLGELLDRPAEDRPYMLIVTGYPAPDATVPVIEKKPLDRIATFID